MFVEYYPERHIPRRKYEAAAIPGRNGNILFPQSAFENEPRSYSVYISAQKTKLHGIINKIAEWLLAPGYGRLEDTYDPEVFRLACYVGDTDIDNIFDEFGRTTLNFDCMPQKFLKSGEYPIVLSTAGTLINPTKWPAKPLIKVNGSGNGNLVLNSDTIALSGINEYLIIDSENMDCYKGNTNCNAKMTGKYPELEGTVNISFTGGITSVEITPRWYEI